MRENERENENEPTSPKCKQCGQRCGVDGTFCRAATQEFFCGPCRDMALAARPGLAIQRVGMLSEPTQRGRCMACRRKRPVWVLGSPDGDTVVICKDCFAECSEAIDGDGGPVEPERGH